MKSETFWCVVIGNKFYIKGECFVKMNKTQAIGNGGLVEIPASQHVLIPIEKDHVMCA